MPALDRMCPATVIRSALCDEKQTVRYREMRCGVFGILLHMPPYQRRFSSVEGQEETSAATSEPWVLL
jgi:hypothetical protein